MPINSKYKYILVLITISHYIFNYRAVQEIRMWSRKSTHERYEQVFWDVTRKVAVDQAPRKKALENWILKVRRVLFIYIQLLSSPLQPHHYPKTSFSFYVRKYVRRISKEQSHASLKKLKAKYQHLRKYFFGTAA